jgi:putative hemolysin
LRSLSRFGLLVAACGLLIAPTSVLASNISAEPDTAASAAYCTSSGGTVEHRVPEYGTNGPSVLRLAGSHDFCVFTAGDGSHIHLFLSTLYTKQPTLAALAYYAQVPIGQCNGNPASCYCTLLGGSDQFGGTNAAGGAWVGQTSIDTDLETCIFPDLSSIDSWGLTYHSAGIIRGIDLSTVLRYANPFAKTRQGKAQKKAA